jgi:serine phosphatase RsbU (regulator of sigma subunit)
MIIEWVEGEEKDKRLQKAVFEKINHIAYDYDYNNSFVVSNVTGHYWDENGSLIDTMSKNDPDDNWFYETISSELPISVSFDYNEERKDTFVFVNALIGDSKNAIAVTGIGLNLKDVSKEFENFKYGEQSNLWLIDHEGSIYLSDNVQYNGENIGNVLTEDIKTSILNDFENGTQILEYKNIDNESVDLISFPLKSTNLKLLVEIPRFETVSFLNKIKWNTIVASALLIFAIIFLFYIVSVKLANPYKRALELNEQLEQKVEERTKELIEKNMKIMDSIDYAKRIQESILPTTEQLESLFNDYFLLWRPRDIVGGDFYWSKRIGEDDYLIAVGDCTGHGVPGALMSMLSISVLNHVVDYECKDDPGFILQKLNQFIKETLNQDSLEVTTDDGLDIGLCYIKKGKELIFSGAKCSLYVATYGKDVAIYNGDKRSIGYRRTAKEFVYTNQVVPISKEQRFYMSTDGFFDQNGGPKDYSFGKKRFLSLINMYYEFPLSEQKKLFEQQLEMFMGDETQRDDITVIAFRP